MCKRPIQVLIVFVLIGNISVLTKADWNEGDPHKMDYVFLPDLSVIGTDVDVSGGLILIDDFLCDESGPILDIHIWGSWLNDVKPNGNPSDVTFYLSIHENDNGQPGQLLWWRQFTPGMFVCRQYASGLQEGWMQPNDGAYIFPGDTECWQYNFYINPDDAFEQVSDTRYWLDVEAIPSDVNAKFGWKTTPLDAEGTANWARWNWEMSTGDSDYNPGSTWNLLIYGQEHPYAFQGVNFSFVIGSTPQPEELDFGDAPDPCYPTLAANNGASHIITGPWLGDAASMPDAEDDGQPDPNALGDDFDGNDDEDGVAIPILLIGQATNIAITVNGGGGNLDAWIDWNGDQVWQDPDERIFGGYLWNGNHLLAVTPPANSVVGQTFARFRISIRGQLSPNGPATDGEVEDYEVYLEEEQPEELDFGDAPDPNYPTLAANNGASHIITGPWLGDATDTPDAELDGQPDNNALGDDNDGNDDEDGVAIPILTIGQATNIAITVNGGGGNLDAWIDWNGDQVWQDPDEQIFGGYLWNGNHLISVTPPANSVVGQTFARFRISIRGQLSPTGPADNGEVEDYEVYLEEGIIVEACCMPDGNCVDIEAGECLAIGGVPQGPGTECATCQCPTPVVITAGTDYWATTHAEIHFGSGDMGPIPEDFFGPGSDPFTGTVSLVGEPVDPCICLADTIIKRLEDAFLAEPPTPIDIELTDLQLISTEPIRVTYNGQPDSFFDVYMGLHNPQPAIGQMNISGNENGGMFDFSVRSGIFFSFNNIDGSPGIHRIDFVTISTSEPYPWQNNSPLMTVRPSCEWAGFYPSGQGPLKLQIGTGSSFQEITYKDPLPMDFDEDGDVDFEDFASFAGKWLFGSE